mgnify:CR=1 FL=1
MKNQISKYLLIALIVIFTILLATLIYIKFFNNNKNDEYALLTEKAEGEVKYLDYTIIELMNKLNNISYSRYQVTIKEVNESEQQNNSSGNSESAGNGMQIQDGSTNQQGSESKENGSGSNDNNSNNSESESLNQSEARTSRLAQVDSLLNSNYDDVPWDEISYGVETIYTAWPSISLDMKALNINDSDISNFSTTLDGIAQAVKVQDKNSALINLYNLYLLLPKYLSYFSSNEYTLNVYNTKAYVLSSYVSANSENWEDMNTNITNAINTLSKNMESTDLKDIEKSTIEKSYALLEELKRGIGLEDKEIFYLKYKLAMEQLEIL